MSTGRNRVTYKDAGVDIDAGDALVDRIAPAAKATARPGAGADLGGFGGLFDLKAAGFKDPLLVASTDGVGTKVKLAIDMKRYDTIGQDLVAMCVNDIVVQGARAAVLPRLLRDGRARRGCGSASGRGHRARLQGVGLRADRRRDRGDAGTVRQGRFRSRRLCRRRGGARRSAARRSRRCARAMC